MRVTIAAVVLALTPLVAAQKPAAPALADLLKTGAAYHDAYALKASGVTLEEQFLLVEVSGNRMQVPQRIASDLVMLTVAGQVQSLRDVFAVDSKPVRERKPRIVQVLAAPTAANWQTAVTFAREHAQYLRSNVILWYSDPTLALQFIASPTQPAAHVQVGRQ